MNRQQLLLTKLTEECNEVAQIALKTQQFGFDEIRREQPYTNAERTHQELDDLNAIIEMLNEEYNFNYKPNRTRIAVKKDKVNRYAAYSVKLGTLT